MTDKMVIHTDGGSRGNPGPAGVGIVIDVEGKTLHEFGKTIGHTTNNVAEYTAVIEALMYIKSIKGERDMVHKTFYLDSKLVVEQLNGNFKIKDARLRELSLKIRMLEQEVGGVITYSYVPREQNTRADLQVNKALDNS